MASLQPRKRLALFVALSQLLFPLHTLPLQAQETPATTIQEAIARPGESSSGMEGIASYYAKRYHGRRTSSGVRYHPEKLTAASAELPLGSRVKVQNLANGKETVVTVNDRCRKRKTPFIDLSRAAARKLGFLGKGIARVKIFLLGEDEHPEMIAQETLD
jgi:rare lipoprotein A